MTTDDVDTAPTILTSATNVEFESIELDPGERGEIVLGPDRPMRCPTLYLSCSGKVAVESVLHGRATINAGQWTTEILKMGRQINVLASRDEPVKVAVTNTGTERSSVGASLVSSPEKGES